MPYRITNPHELPVEVRRVAEEQIDRALDEFDDEELGRSDLVHQLRKRCKKLRGLLRLVRGSLGDDDGYDRENARFRDAAKTLSKYRDAEVLRETYDGVMDFFDRGIDRASFGVVRRRFTDRLQDLMADEEELDQRLDDFRERLREARRRVPEWAAEVEDWDGIEPGLIKTYGRARKAMSAALDELGSERFHEWRKRVKYHGYHCRLLRDSWRPVWKARLRELGRLGDILGDEHDLAVFREAVAGEGDDFPGPRRRAALFALIERRQESLRREAIGLGRRLFAAKPKALAAEFARCWRAWDEENEPAREAVAA